MELDNGKEYDSMGKIEKQCYQQIEIRICIFLSPVILFY